MISHSSNSEPKKRADEGRRQMARGLQAAGRNGWLGFIWFVDAAVLRCAHHLQFVPADGECGQANWDPAPQLQEQRRVQLELVSLAGCGHHGMDDFAFRLMKREHGTHTNW
jgi:hypothetical protein